MACRSAVTMSASAKTNSGLSARCSRLAARPVAKLSSPTTVFPSPSRRSTSVEPMNPAAPVTSARTGPPYRGVVLAAAGLIAVQLAIRAVLAFGGYFYWDDLILIGRAGTQGLLSPSYLFDDHDGHVMPGARSEEHTSELQSHVNIVCRLLLEKKKKRHRSLGQRSVDES